MKEKKILKILLDLHMYLPLSSPLVQRKVFFGGGALETTRERRSDRLLQRSERWVLKEPWGNLSK